MKDLAEYDINSCKLFVDKNGKNMLEKADLREVKIIVRTMRKDEDALDDDVDIFLDMLNWLFLTCGAHVSSSGICNYSEERPCLVHLRDFIYEKWGGLSSFNEMIRSFTKSFKKYSSDPLGEELKDDDKYLCIR